MILNNNKGKRSVTILIRTHLHLEQYSSTGQFRVTGNMFKLTGPVHTTLTRRDGLKHICWVKRRFTPHEKNRQFSQNERSCFNHPLDF